MPKEKSKEARSQESGADVQEKSSSSSSTLLAPALPAQISSKVVKSYTSLTGTEAASPSPLTGDTTCVESLSNSASTSLGEGSAVVVSVVFALFCLVSSWGVQKHL